MYLIDLSWSSICTPLIFHSMRFLGTSSFAVFSRDFSDKLQNVRPFRVSSRKPYSLTGTAPFLISDRHMCVRVQQRHFPCPESLLGPQIPLTWPRQTASQLVSVCWLARFMLLSCYRFHSDPRGGPSQFSSSTG